MWPATNVLRTAMYSRPEAIHTSSHQPATGFIIYLDERYKSMTLDENLFTYGTFGLMVLGTCCLIYYGAQPEVPRYDESDGMTWKVWYRTIYLKTPYWKRIRKIALERDSYRCRVCGRPTTEVHHLSYKFLTIQHRHMDQLISLCSYHHRKVHKKLTTWDRIKRFLES